MGRQKIYDDRNKYHKMWTKANRDTILLKVPKGEKAVIQGFAKQQGVSVTTLIRRSIQLHTDDIYNKADEDTKADIDRCVDDFRKQQAEKDNSESTDFHT